MYMYINIAQLWIGTWIKIQLKSIFFFFAFLFVALTRFFHLSFIVFEMVNSHFLVSAIIIINYYNYVQCFCFFPYLVCSFFTWFCGPSKSKQPTSQPNKLLSILFFLSLAFACFSLCLHAVSDLNQLFLLLQLLLHLSIEVFYAIDFSVDVCMQN